MKKNNYLRMVLTLGIGWVAMNQSNVQAADVWDEESETLSTDNTLYYSNGTYINDAKKIIITTSGDSGLAPLGGFGIYGNSSYYDLRGKQVIITTAGSKSDAVQINPGTSTIYLGDGLIIKTTGSSADGINLTENAQGSKVFVGDNANIQTNGIGIRSNNSINNSLTNKIQVGDGLTVITTGNGSNILEGDGYGVYAGLRSWKASSQKSDSYLIIGKDSTIQISGSSAHAIYANNSGKIVLGDNTDIRVSGATASGLRAESASGKLGDTGITLLGNTKITTTQSGQYAMYAIGNGTTKGIITNVDGDNTLDAFSDQDLFGNPIGISNTQRVFSVTGDFQAGANGLIDLDMTNGTEIVGKSTLAGTGKINFQIDGSQSFWKLTGNSTMSNLTLTDGATVYLSDETNLATRQVLTITDDYHGTNGKFVFNGVLDGDGSPIDKVIINGNATGTTKVAVNNLGGLGEKTINGIQIIQVDGTSLAGTFTQAGRIVAGAYDYFVTKGDELGNDTNNWYLTNKTSSKEVINPEFPNQPIVRPEGGAYLGNAYGANNLFQLTLHDRVGEVGLLHWKDDGLKDKSQNIWAHANTKKVSMDEKSEQIRLKQDYNSMRVGFDLVRKKENDRTYLFGIMGGYGQVKTHGKGLLYEAEGNISGYNVGLYGTIYDEHPDKSGKYLDTWVSWNDFDGQVAGGGLAVEKYGLSGVTASIEAGYDQLARNNKANENRNLWLKWQAQVTYQGVSGDGHREENGTYVSKNDDNIQTRLGVRLYQKVKESNGRWYQPYAELNWYHNTGTYDISMDGDRDFSTSGVENMGELKLGYEGQISKRLQLWGNISGGLGSKGAYTYGARLGLKYTF